MIFLDKKNQTKPYKKFYKLYDIALKKMQLYPEAAVISSYDKALDIVDSRFVNIKYILDDEWIFFSNYNSPKSKQFNSHNQVSAILYWNSINVQIRMKAHIKRTKSSFSDTHFHERSFDKNILSISSDQSAPIENYEKFLTKYNLTLSKAKSDNTIKRPEYWGGFSFFPYSFEFWEGHASRLNKRELYLMQNDLWVKSTLQP